ncbi:MAG TPA: hypothetical protein VIX59_08970 [Candidatus Binataceae bacterium]
MFDGYRYKSLILGDEGRFEPADPEVPRHHELSDNLQKMVDRRELLAAQRRKDPDTTPSIPVDDEERRALALLQGVLPPPSRSN